MRFNLRSIPAWKLYDYLYFLGKSSYSLLGADLIIREVLSQLRVELYKIEHLTI